MRFAGHGLVSEGIPRFRSATCTLNPQCRDFGDRIAASEPEMADDRMPYEAGCNDGHARCSCGAESPHLPSQGARRRWHADHKAAIAAGYTKEGS